MLSREGVCSLMQEGCSLGRRDAQWERRDAPSGKKGAPWGGGMLNGEEGACWGGVLPGEEGCSPQCSLGRRGPPWGKGEASLLGVGEGQLLSSPGLTDPRAVLWPLPWSPS